MDKTYIKREENTLSTDDTVPLAGMEKVDFTAARDKVPCFNKRTFDFINTFFPEISFKDWNDWKWQLKNSIRNFEDLKKYTELTPDEFMAFSGEKKNLPLRITPYFVSQIWRNGPENPLRKTMVPRIEEFSTHFGEEADPLKEDADSPIPGIVHRYPDRVLFLVTSFCSAYCRYCTRSRLVGTSSHNLTPSNWENALKYIESNSAIRDVLLSGGDPLTLTDRNIDYLLSRLRKIPHVEFIRIGTKVPVVLPQRVTPSLVKILKKYHPLYLSIHFIHPAEITPETAGACNMLADAGIPLGSQTVLLKNINDDISTMMELMHKLLLVRVKPYYLYQCDPIPGSGHFRTSISKGLEIIQGLRGFTSGYAVPHYVIDAPGGGGKIPLLPEYYVRRDEKYVYLKNYTGDVYQYPDPL